ncbi:hypothetical protein D3C85_1802510 [compost metagenome]
MLSLLQQCVQIMIVVREERDGTDQVIPGVLGRVENPPILREFKQNLVINFLLS